MSLKRYYISGLHPHIWEHPEGEMVYFEDYVTLWAENARLKAEVERLRKAGDAMATNIPRMVTCQVTAHEAVDFMNDWNAAKEGKPSV